MAVMRHDRPLRVRNLIAFTTLLMFVFGGKALYDAFQEYDFAIGKGKENAERLTNILSDQVEISFLAVDLTLQSAVERQNLNMLFGDHLPEDVTNHFNFWVRQAPQIVAMILVNERGDIELGVHDKQGTDYDGWIDYSRSLSASEPFLTLKRHDDVFTVITPYQHPRNAFSNLVLVSRKINKLDGTFGGMVTAAVPGEYFLDFLAAIDTREKHRMSLMLQDGRDLLASLPHSRNGEGIDGQTKEKILGVGQGKVQSALEKFGGADMQLSWRTLERFPITVSVQIEQRTFLANFLKARIKDVAFLFIFFLFGSIVMFSALTMARQTLRAEESEAAAILASQAKSEFLANMSHELRTPLNAIIGFSEMMNSGYFGAMNAKQKERMSDINLCGNHLLHLISDILEFSKGEAGKLELVEERCSIPEIVQEVVRMMGEKVKSKGINLTLDVTADMPKVFADKRKIKQIFINLVSNALKFTPQEGDIKLSARLDAHGALNMVVSDTGIGIAEEDIPKALSVFGQVHRSKSHEGTGLGLPLCKMFAELHGGKLSLMSVVGEGTTVRVVLPAARVIKEAD